MEFFAQFNDFICIWLLLVGLSIKSFSRLLTFWRKRSCKLLFLFVYLWQRRFKPTQCFLKLLYLNYSNFKRLRLVVKNSMKMSFVLYNTYHCMAYLFYTTKCEIRTLNLAVLLTLILFNKRVRGTVQYEPAMFQLRTGTFIEKVFKR